MEIPDSTKSYIKKRARHYSFTSKGDTFYEVEDFIQEATLRCIESFPRFDPSRSKLQTFLSYQVNGAMYDMLRKRPTIGRYAKQGKGGKKAAFILPLSVLLDEGTDPADPHDFTESIHDEFCLSKFKFLVEQMHEEEVLTDREYVLIYLLSIGVQRVDIAFCLNVTRQRIVQMLKGIKEKVREYLSERDL